MIFKSIYFDLDRQEYPNQYGYSLLMKSRFFCNYIEREVLKPIRVNTPGFNRIVIRFTDNPTNKILVNSSNVLVLDQKFNKTEYENASKTNIADFFIKSLQLVNDKLRDTELNIPIDKINIGIESFIKNGYINEWLHAKKTNRQLGIESCLNCKLTEDFFELTLDISKNKNRIYSQVILNTEPDPVAYDYRFKDIQFKDNLLIITGKTSANLLELDLNELNKNNC